MKWSDLSIGRNLDERHGLKLIGRGSIGQLLRNDLVVRTLLAAGWGPVIGGVLLMAGHHRLELMACLCRPLKR